jgi:hypothetical protein
MGTVSPFCAYGNENLLFLPVNTAVTLWFKFLLLPGMERFLIYGNLKWIDDLTMHRVWQFLKN